MDPFPVQYINSIWHVIIADKAMPCASEDDAKLIAQIPVQLSLTYDDGPHPPDRQAVAATIATAGKYGLMTMPAVRRLMSWYKRA
jgi:hypothetical protein